MQQLIIRPKDVLVLEGVCYDTARRRIQAVRVALSLPNRTKVTILEYSRHYGIDEAQIQNALKRR